MARPPIAFLICPDCRRPLEPPPGPDGVGACPGCKRPFGYHRHVTDMAPSDVLPLTQQTVSQFGASWQIHDHLADFQYQQFLDWVAPLNEEDFRDRVILEAGSGKGRHTLIMSGFEPSHLLSIDLSDAILLAAENTRGCPRTYCIRGDLLKLPILDGSVDLVVCLGVLHHLEDPLAGLKELWSKLKPGGAFCLWVYGREGNTWIVCLADPIRRHLTSRIPTRWLRPLLWPLTLTLFVLLKVLYAPATRRGLRPVTWLPYSTYLGYISKFPFMEIEHIVLDHLCPPVAFYLPKDQLESWFRELGAVDVRLRWHNQNSWNVVARKPA